MEPSTSKASDILELALLYWQDDFLNHLYLAWDDLEYTLPVGDSRHALKERVLSTMEGYLTATRIILIEEYLKTLGEDLGTATPSDVDHLNPTSVLWIRATRIVNHYGVPRVFLHLFSHAWLLSVLGKPSPIERFKDIFEIHDPR